MLFIVFRDLGSFSLQKKAKRTRIHVSPVGFFSGWVPESSPNIGGFKYKNCEKPHHPVTISVLFSPPLPQPARVKRANQVQLEAGCLGTDVFFFATKICCTKMWKFWKLSFFGSNQQNHPKKSICFLLGSTESTQKTTRYYQ